MMLMRKLGKSAKRKLGGRKKRCDPSYHDIVTTEPAAIEQFPTEPIPDMSTLPKDGVPVKRSTRCLITKESRERMALMRKLRKCVKCKPGNKQCHTSHHDVSTTKSAAFEQALIPRYIHTCKVRGGRKQRPCRKSKKRRGVRRRQHMREIDELSSTLPNSPEPVKHAITHSELFSKYSKKRAQQLARQGDWSRDQKEEDLERLREVRRERVAGWDDACREEENRKW